VPDSHLNPLTVRNSKEDAMATVGTVEDLRSMADFVDKARALLNPETVDFGINRFGFCRKCRAVTQYTGDYSLEGCTTKCLKCGNTFGDDWGSQKSLDVELYCRKTEEMPESVRAEVVRLNSRNNQMQIFLAALTQFIKKCKNEARRSRNALRALRALQRKAQDFCEDQPSLDAKR
jgi:hypothetical protein